MQTLDNPACRTCGRCCAVFWTFTRDKDTAMRFLWLRTDKIEVIKVRDCLWKIIYHFPCSKLIEENGKFSCANYDTIRPEFCKTYPANFVEGKEREPAAFELEKLFCPLLGATQ